jgi:uncharacterized protein YjiS (DUF1127 family)
MPSLLSAFACAAKATRSGRSARGLAELDDHLLHDLGLRRTDLYALPHLHAARLKATSCRLRDVVLSLLPCRHPSCC